MSTRLRLLSLTVLGSWLILFAGPLVGDASAQWKILMRAMQNPLPLGECAYVEIAVYGADGRPGPMRPDGMQVNAWDFDFTITSASPDAFRFQNEDPTRPYICARAPTAPSATFTVHYPGRQLKPNQVVPGVELRQSIEVAMAGVPAAAPQVASGSAAQPNPAAGAAPGYAAGDPAGAGYPNPGYPGGNAASGGYPAAGTPGAGNPSAGYAPPGNPTGGHPQSDPAAAAAAGAAGVGGAYPQGAGAYPSGGAGAGYPSPSYPSGSPSAGGYAGGGYPQGDPASGYPQGAAHPQGAAYPQGAGYPQPSGNPPTAAGQPAQAGVGSPPGPHGQPQPAGASVAPPQSAPAQAEAEPAVKSLGGLFKKIGKHAKRKVGEVTSQTVENIAGGASNVVDNSLESGAGVVSSAALEATNTVRTGVGSVGRSLTPVALRGGESSDNLATVMAAGGAELRMLRFTGNTDVLEPAARDLITRLAAALNATQGNFVIEAHADPLPSPAESQQLSEHRAAAVKQALIRNGVVPTRLKALGYGASEPKPEVPPGGGAPSSARVVVVRDAPATP